MCRQHEKLSGTCRVALAASRDQTYQEACLRAYVGGAKDPLFLSSGLEDYFLSSGFFHHGQRYYNAAAGLTTFGRDKNQFSAYRVHDDDPIFFQDGHRLTLRCGEQLDGKIFHSPPPTRYTVYTWVYER